jgi:hypothetical protein
MCPGSRGQAKETDSQRRSHQPPVVIDNSAYLSLSALENLQDVAKNTQTTFPHRNTSRNKIDRLMLASETRPGSVRLSLKRVKGKNPSLDFELTKPLQGIESGRNRRTQGDEKRLILPDFAAGDFIYPHKCRYLFLQRATARVEHKTGEKL